MLIMTDLALKAFRGNNNKFVKADNSRINEIVKNLFKSQKSKITILRF